jgi:CHAD domain-containing protein
VARAPLDLALPADLDPDGAVELVAARLRTGNPQPSNSDRILLDTFDGRLRAVGLHAEHDGRDELTLHEEGVPVRRAEVGLAAAYPLEALPPGPLRERLRGVLGLRALLPLARVRSRRVELAVLDGDEKTVVRLAVEHPRLVVRGRGETALTPRVTLRPVRGYDAAFDRAQRGLALDPAPGTLLDEAAPAPPPAKVRLKPGTRTDAAARRVLDALADVAEANVPGTLADLDTEFLHDLRVAIRRARSVLRELTDVHEPAARAHLRAELRWAQALTGPVRDLDVQLLDLAAADSDLEPLRRLLARRRATELAKLGRGLRSRRFAALLEAWRTIPSGGPRAGEPIGETAAKRIRKVRRRMLRDGKAIGDHSPDTELHELRKRGKELRYLLELFGDTAVDDPAPMIKALKRLQDVLGAFQDLAVEIAQLRDAADELAAEPGGTDALLAVGQLIAGLEDRQHAARDAFAERFARFAQ